MEVSWGLWSGTAHLREVRKWGPEGDRWAEFLGGEQEAKCGRLLWQGPPSVRTGRGEVMEVFRVCRMNTGW